MSYKGLASVNLAPMISAGWLLILRLARSVMDASNPRTQEVLTGGLKVWDQSGLHGEALSQLENK